MSFIKVPEEMFEQDITPAQFKIICALIKFSFEDNKSYLGHTKLAEYCRMDKTCIIRNLKQLAAAGYVNIRARGTFSRSNEITLNMERLTAGSPDGGLETQGLFKSTPQGLFKSTPQGLFKSTQGLFKSTPHIDKRFKNQDLNKNAREEGLFKSTPKEEKENNYIATGDGAPVRSMPEPGLPGRDKQGSEGGEFTAKDKQIARFLLKNNSHFDDWYRLSRSPNGEYFVNPVTDFIGKIIPLNQRVVSAPDGVHVCNYAAPSNHIIIDFQQLSKCI